MAEIKKINGNTLCDDVARDAAGAAKTAADEAMAKAAVQPDWNDGDPTSPAYIKNRIGGYKRSEEERRVVYDETTAEYIDVCTMDNKAKFRYRKVENMPTNLQVIGGSEIVISAKNKNSETIDLRFTLASPFDDEFEDWDVYPVANWSLEGHGYFEWLSYCISDAVVMLVMPQGGSVSGIGSPFVNVEQGVWLLDFQYYLDNGGGIDDINDFVPVEMSCKSISLGELVQASSGMHNYPAEALMACDLGAAEDRLDTFSRNMGEIKPKVGYINECFPAKRGKYSGNYIYASGSTKFECAGKTYKKFLELPTRRDLLYIDHNTERFTEFYEGKNCFTTQKTEPDYVFVTAPGTCSFAGSPDAEFNAPATGIYTKHDAGTWEMGYNSVEKILLCESVLNIKNGELCVDGEPVSKTYTPGTGIAISDTGVISADVSEIKTYTDEALSALAGDGSDGRKMLKGVLSNASTRKYGFIYPPLEKGEWGITRIQEPDDESVDGIRFSFGRGTDKPETNFSLLVADGKSTIGFPTPQHFALEGVVRKGGGYTVSNVLRYDFNEDDQTKKMTLLSNVKGATEAEGVVITTRHGMDAGSETTLITTAIKLRSSRISDDDGVVLDAIGGQLLANGRNMDFANPETNATEFYLKSSTADSTKRFKITVTDDGTLAATEVV